MGARFALKTELKFLHFWRNIRKFAIDKEPAVKLKWGSWASRKMILNHAYYEQNEGKEQKYSGTPLKELDLQITKRLS